MVDMETIAASLNALLTTYGVTRDQIADLLGGAADGGPNGDGNYPVTLANGTTSLVPSPRRLAALSGDVGSAVAAIQPILEAAKVEAAKAATAAQESEAAFIIVSAARDLTLAARDEVLAQRQIANLYVPVGQSLTPGRGPQVTAAGAVDPGLYTFIGGPEAPYVTSPPPLDVSTIPIDPANWSEIVPFVPGNPGNTETWGPGLGYQSAKSGVKRSFFFVPGSGSMPLRMLHRAHMRNNAMGLESAVRLLRREGFEPKIIYFFVQGHGDTQTTDDGNNPGFAPTTAVEYLIGAAKLFVVMRMAATLALGYDYLDVIWVTPLLTSNGVSSFEARRQIVLAQGMMPQVIPGVRLLPPHSQFANLMDSDLTHPLGQAYRYYAELAAAYPNAGVTVPRITRVALVAGVVEVTFDQPVKYSVVPDATARGASRDGFTVIDNTGAEVPVTATAIVGTVVKLSVASVASLNGNWFVRNGLQQLIAVGTLGFPEQHMPRTRIAGLVDAGVAQDGTPLENLSIPEEKQA